MLFDLEKRGKNSLNAISVQVIWQKNCMKYIPATLSVNFDKIWYLENSDQHTFLRLKASRIQKQIEVFNSIFFASIEVTHF